MDDKCCGDHYNQHLKLSWKLNPDNKRTINTIKEFHIFLTNGPSEHKKLLGKTQVPSASIELSGLVLRELAGNTCYLVVEGLDHTNKLAAISNEVAIASKESGNWVVVK